MFTAAISNAAHIVLTGKLYTRNKHHYTIWPKPLKPNDKYVAKRE